MQVWWRLMFDAGTAGLKLLLFGWDTPMRYVSHHHIRWEMLLLEVLPIVIGEIREIESSALRVDPQ